MSASAGKVMPRPMGDYNAATEYKILDIVEYNHRPYMAKQTTQGNLPTNTTYWQLLLDFPTEVDAVPTQNSQNLVYSGGVYGATANKMNTDGSNASGLKMYSGLKTSFMTAAITKDSGDNQDVSLVFTVANANSNLAMNILGILTAHIDDVVVYVDGSEIGITLDSATKALDSSTVTATGKLVTDASDAISTSAMIYLYAYNDGGIGDIVAGAGSAVKTSGMAIGKIATSDATNGVALGENTSAMGNNSVAEGKNTTTSGDQSHAEGSNNYAMGTACHAEGYNNFARGDYSHVGGRDNSVSGDNAFAHGRGLSANRDNMAAFGKYNSDYAYSGKLPLLAVGNGADSSNKANAFTVYEDGYVSIGAGHNRFKFTQNNGAWGFYDDDNVFHICGKIRLSQSVTLSTSGDTTVTFTNAAITTNSVIKPLTSVWGLCPTAVTTSNGSCVLTLAKASSADTITVAIEIS